MLGQKGSQILVYDDPLVKRSKEKESKMVSGYCGGFLIRSFDQWGLRVAFFILNGDTGKHHAYWKDCFNLCSLVTKKEDAQDVLLSIANGRYGSTSFVHIPSMALISMPLYYTFLTHRSHSNMLNICFCIAFDIVGHFNLTLVLTTSVAKLSTRTILLPHDLSDELTQWCIRTFFHHCSSTGSDNTNTHVHIRFASSPASARFFWKRDAGWLTTLYFQSNTSNIYLSIASAIVRWISLTLVLKTSVAAILSSAILLLPKPFEASTPLCGRIILFSLLKFN